MISPADILTRSETGRYRRLKLFVKRWVSDRFEAGAALAEIRDNKLYRAEYPTFEEFVQTEYKIERAHAYRLIEAAAVKMSPIGDKIQNVSQADALARVPEADREKVLGKISGRVTAKSIARAAVTVELDHVGKPIPDQILEDWKRADDLGSQLSRDVSAVKCRLEKAMEDQDILLAEVNNTAVVDLKNAYRAVGLIVPWAVCPRCRGRGRNDCRLCGKRGFISRFKYDNHVAEEDKQ